MKDGCNAPAPMNPDYRKYWQLDSTITFLNHGSYGACPVAVLEKQRQLRERLEQEPVRFFALELEALLDGARQVLADFVGAEADNLAFVPNATTGVNTVLRSLCLPSADFPALQKGDELLTTTHEYNASRNALNFAAQTSGATVVVAEVPFPIAAPEQAIAAVLAKVSDRTRLVLLDHVTSQTGLVFPLKPLIEQLTAAGVEVLIDGAHAPGMIPLNLKKLGATYYTGNCHKWLCAPKGAAFLYVQPEHRDRLRPLVISHGANSTRGDRSRFRLEFDWTGTADPTPYLCVPEAIQFMGSLLPGGWANMMQQNRAKALATRESLCQMLQVASPSPAAMVGAMAVVPLPNGSAEALQARLFQDFQIEVPVVPWFGRLNRLIRVSAQIYNTQADYDVLARALSLLLAEEIKTT
ncbi:aminotransferase class V-fold PLP-dependent enzyme [Phormidium tenue FACHB-886]|nr:aminotransferase class V-fold PLP-dependent enzyme [Phormidium tenue FACHB-886]